MKKSKLYFIAQMSVMRDDRLPDEEKLELIKVLQERETVEVMLEEARSAENAEDRK